MISSVRRTRRLVHHTEDEELPWQRWRTPQALSESRWMAERPWLGVVPRPVEEQQRQSETAAPAKSENGELAKQLYLEALEEACGRPYLSEWPPECGARRVLSGPTTLDAAVRLPRRESGWWQAAAGTPWRPCTKLAEGSEACAPPAARPRGRNGGATCGGTAGAAAAAAIEGGGARPARAALARGRRSFFGVPLAQAWTGAGPNGEPAAFQDSP